VLNAWLDLSPASGETRLVRAIGINHVSISARDLEESTRFYEELFGMERIATPIFATSVQWLRVGDLQLHLFLDESGSAPNRHHIGLTVDDFDSAYQAIRARTDASWGSQLVELPSGQIQLYFRDPAGNLIELNWPDSSTLDRSRYPELYVLADHMPQTPESERAVLYLDRSLV
jgi:catechol 2,3-dioxygenase-like lactoylglutathione lyase family enzyme